MKDTLKKEDLNILKLRRLYEQYGYVRYKMKKFEEYDLYAANKDFLGRDHIITFTDTNGKLLALKPDVTLSIVKNYRDGTAGVERVYYNENVYRTSRSSRTFKEIMQMGLECMGDLDICNTVEVLVLAAQSLAVFSGDYILDLSHMGVIRGLLEALQLKPVDEERLLTCFREKNCHEIRTLAEELGLTEDVTETITALAESYGPADQILSAIKPLVMNDAMAEAVEELEYIADTLKSLDIKNVHLDFSIVNDTSYYNGVLFRGYLSGISTGVLAGGRYDELMDKMGKCAGAIGFALNLDLIDDYDTVTEDYDTDILLLYDENDSPEELLKSVRALNEQGFTVQAQKVIPEKLKYKELRKL